MTGPSPGRGPGGFAPPGRSAEALAKKLDAEPAIYGRVTRANFPALLGGTPVAPGTADVVLTFRNVHNWENADAAPAYFKAFFNVLKPGGVLGVVDHRAKPGTGLEVQKKSGYLTEALVIELAQNAGFQLEGKSEVNANPKDTADHPNGVWTLPPSNQHDAADNEKYKAIGESDRMTLRFIKPRG